MGQYLGSIDMDPADDEVAILELTNPAVEAKS